MRNQFNGPYKTSFCNTNPLLNNEEILNKVMNITYRLHLKYKIDISFCPLSSPYKTISSKSKINKKILLKQIQNSIFILKNVNLYEDSTTQHNHSKNYYKISQRIKKIVNFKIKRLINFRDPNCLPKNPKRVNISLKRKRYLGRFCSN